MKNMGLTDLVLINPKSFPHDEAYTRSSNARDILDNARVVSSMAEALTGCTLAAALTSRRRELAPALITPRAAAAKLVGEAQHSHVALVFGNETNGLSIDEVQLCNVMVTIPTNPHYSSLNVAQAVQILTYECRMAVTDSIENVAEHHPLASHEENEHFFAHLEQTLREIGFLKPHRPKRLMPRLRRLFGRATLEKEEVDILRGLLRAVQTRSATHELE